MKEHPILFSGAMVRAILVGNKTQTRRVVKDDYFACLTGDCPHETQFECDQAIASLGLDCPYGIVGDRLWVRETFAYTDESLNFQPGWVYRSTDPDWSELEGFKWKPSIFMPRKASRITLEIVSIRVERLQDISEEDARAEGVSFRGITRFEKEAAMLYAELWESLHGAGSWAANPWVWVIGFQPLTSAHSANNKFTMPA